MTRGVGQHTVLLSDAGIGVPADTFDPVVRLEQTSNPDAPFAVTRVGSTVYSFLGMPGAAPNGKWGTLNPKNEPIWVLNNPDGGPVDTGALGPLRAAALFPVEGESDAFAVMGARHAFLQGSTTALHVAQPLAPGEEFVALSMSVEGAAMGAMGSAWRS
ncbi:hypothetical protein ACN28S_29565 [Cystobacter fuscus]